MQASTSGGYAWRRLQPVGVGAGTARPALHQFPQAEACATSSRLSPQADDYRPNNPAYVAFPTTWPSIAFRRSARADPAGRSSLVSRA